MVRASKVDLQRARIQSRQAQFFIFISGALYYLLLCVMGALDIRLGYSFPRLLTFPLRQAALAYLVRGRALTPKEESLLFQGIWAFYLVFLYPSLFYTFWKVVAWTYTRKVTLLEERVKVLQGEQKYKLEELKKRTKFYLMKDLVERYEKAATLNVNSPGGLQLESPMLGSQGKRRSIDKLGLKASVQGAQPANPPQPENKQSQVQNQTQPPSHAPSAMSHTKNLPLNGLSAEPWHNLPPVASPSGFAGSRTWMDRLLDLLVGEDAKSSSLSQDASLSNSLLASGASVFALVCHQCGNHNGLVTLRDYRHLKYQCPRCGFWALPEESSFASGANGTKLSHSMTDLIHGKISPQRTDRSISHGCLDPGQLAQSKDLWNEALRDEDSSLLLLQDELSQMDALGELETENRNNPSESIATEAGTSNDPMHSTMEHPPRTPKVINAQESPATPSSLAQSPATPTPSKSKKKNK
jgi:predicted RNA-binding Zn-ribbon protein involved in translation (DUF1610 family)